MNEVWSLPGYDVQAMVGFGSTGEVWRARELATGDTVALKRLREGADPLALEALRREASLLRTLDTPYVVRLRAVVGDVLVLDHAPGGSLATLLVRRGTLDAGEVVTIAGPLASALACAHGLGLVHGDVSPANVLFTSDGMPLLADLGVARVVGESRATVEGTAEYVDPAVAAGADPDAASDVYALAAVCFHLLAGTPPHDGDTIAEVLGAVAAGERAPLGLLAPAVPRALVAAVEAGLCADRARRPDAVAFASLLRRAHAAAPVRLTGGPPLAPEVRATHVVRAAPTQVPTGQRRARFGRRPARVSLAKVSLARVLAGAGLVLLVGLAAAVGWLSGRGQAPTAAALAPEVSRATVASRAPVESQAPAAGAIVGVPVTPAQWAQQLDALDTARAAAFAAADPSRLSAVWAPGSSGLAGDTAAVAGLRVAGGTAHGLRHALSSVRVSSTSAKRAQLQVVDVLHAHEVRSADGTVVGRFAARGSARWVVELVATADGWRLLSVLAQA